MADCHMPSQEYLRQRLAYDPDTGFVTWKDRPLDDFPSRAAHASWQGRFPGKRAGSYGKGNDYVALRFQSRAVSLHRVIWVYMTGRLPDGDIDHINGNKRDNRWLNLRDVTRSVNMQNAPLRSDNRSGTQGVFWCENLGRWRSMISVNGRRVYLGYHEALADAVLARKTAERKYGYHPNHGRVARCT